MALSTSFTGGWFYLGQFFDHAVELRPWRFWFGMANVISRRRNDGSRPAENPSRLGSNLSRKRRHLDDDIWAIRSHQWRNGGAAVVMLRNVLNNKATEG